MAPHAPHAPCPPSSRLRLALAGAAAALLATACAETRSWVRDDSPPGTPRGYVGIYTRGQGEELPLQVVGIADGNELPAVKNGDAWSGVGDLRLARAPGPHEFMVRHQNYGERFRVPVEEGRVTLLSFRRQITSVVTTGNVTTTSYAVRGSMGKRPLPADPAAADPAPYLAALGDPDWGTRHLALSRLAALKPRLEAETAAAVRRMAVEDRVAAVRDAARALLSAEGLPVPASPLLLDAFENNPANRWHLGGGSGDPVRYSFEADGYQIAATEARDHWVVIALGKLLEQRADVDFAADCTWKGGPVASGFGLVLGRDKNAFHAFLVSRNGGAMSASYAGGAWKPAALPWVQAAAKAIAAAPGTRIAVSKRGATYAMSVNGVAVGSFTDREDLPLGSVGFLVSGAQTVTFDRLVVSAP